MTTDIHGPAETILATLHQHAAAPYYLALLSRLQLAVQGEIARVYREMPQQGNYAPLGSQPVRLRKLCSNGCCFECEDCSRKSGSPILCADCLERRARCPAKKEDSTT